MLKGRSEGEFFFASPYCPLGNLTEYLASGSARGPPSGPAGSGPAGRAAADEELLGFAQDLISAGRYLEGRAVRVYNRDPKPENVLVVAASRPGEAGSAGGRKRLKVGCRCAATLNHVLVVRRRREGCVGLVSGSGGAVEVAVNDIAH